MIDLSIIIVNWNSKDVLKDCLNSIYKSRFNSEYEILVVDNGSSDNSAEVIEKQFPHVRLIKNKENAGYAQANNQAIGESKGRYVLLLNPDTIILNNAIEKMVDFLSKNKDIGILGPKIFRRDGSLQISCYRFYSLSSLFSTKILFTRFGKGWFYKNFDYNQTKEVDVVAGACLLIKREMIKNVGLLDERFFMYSEEADWCFRAKKSGWKVVFYPEAEIIHLIGASSENIQEEMDVEAYRSQTKFFNKHFSKKKAKAMKTLLFAGVLLRVIVLNFLICFKPTKDNKRRLQKYRTVLKWYLKH